MLALVRVAQAVDELAAARRAAVDEHQLVASRPGIESRVAVEFPAGIERALLGVGREDGRVESGRREVGGVEDARLDLLDERRGGGAGRDVPFTNAQRRTHARAYARGSRSSLFTLFDVRSGGA